MADEGDKLQILYQDDIKNLRCDELVASSSIGAVMEVVNEDKNTMSMMTYMQREWKRGFRRKH